MDILFGKGGLLQDLWRGQKLLSSLDTCPHYIRDYVLAPHVYAAERQAEQDYAQRREEDELTEYVPFGR